jgi:glutaredoxin
LPVSNILQIILTIRSYCRKVKSLFDNLKVPYAAFELDQRDDGPAVQTVLGQMTGATSVPRVFVGGKFIGGCDGKSANLTNVYQFRYLRSP